jgi:subfamily B ATP-binding cassette protein MsbA
MERSLFRRLLPLAWPHRATVFEALVLLVTTTLLDTVVVPLLLAAILLCVVGASTGAIGEPFFIRIVGLDFRRLATLVPGTGDRFSLLLSLGALALLAVLVKCAADARRFYVTHRFGHMVGLDLRERLFRALVGQPVAFHEAQEAGGLLSRITADIAALQSSLGIQLFELIQAPIAVALGVGVLFALSWPLTLATICLAPAVALVLSRAARSIRHRTAARQDRLASLNAYLAERLASVRTIQGFGRETFETAEMSRLNKAYVAGAMRAVMVTELISPLTEFVALAGILAGVLVGGLTVVSGRMAPDHFVFFFAVAPMAGKYVGRLAYAGALWHQIAGATTRVFSLLDLIPAVRDAPSARPLPPARGRVTFERVSFRYRPDSPEAELAGIDLDVAAGEVVALVGPSGAGKTTLVSLVPRFFDPTEGRVLIDGHDLREVTIASLRGQIGLVSQDSLLFNRTVAENIRYGRLDASDREILHAARAANALEFIERLPQAFETPLGERGVTLSAGQRQRIAIARAVLRDPRILVLDEAMSALDSENERLVQAAIGRIVEGRTTFVVAHRLSTLRHVTRIVVRDRGRIVQAGSHDALSAVPGLYRKLYESQVLKGSGATVRP